MPKLDRRITETIAKGLPLPDGKYEIYWCGSAPGFGVRVSSHGDRAYVSERRVNGKTVRRTLGKATGPGAISTDTARKLQVTVSSELQIGIDRSHEVKEARKVEAAESVTLANAVKAYVLDRRRGKDGLPLKKRTRTDYLAMVQPGGTRSDGKPFADGMLYSLADKSIYKITAQQVRDIYKAQAKRSQRQAVYAMQVLRAVINWHGVKIEGSPLDKNTAGRERIILAPTAGKPSPIPPERLAAWWTAAGARAGTAAADGCRFILLTGCRPGEVFGSKYADGMLVGDVDLEGGRVMFADTKNRKDHTVVLSKQALELVTLHCEGKKKGQKVFDVLDPGKTLAAINTESGVVGVTPHKLRHTFASVAEELVSGYALKRMLNHAGNDVTGAHYVGKSENQLRDAWQAVADFIDGRSAKPVKAAANVVPIRKRAAA
jgi:integrase